jgi:replication-associated recombination protein RarA
MQPLYEKYRPRTLEEVVGQDRAVAQVRALLARGIGGRAVWLSGPSGSGKTTLARIIARSIADDYMVTELDSADQLTVSELERWAESMYLSGMGKGGRALIVNEAHGLRRDIIRRLLGVLERLPAHVVVIFTTTKDGQEALFDDYDDAGPLLSRCLRVTLTNQGLAKAFAERFQVIAQTEGLDGQPLTAYVKLMQRPDV